MHWNVQGRKSDTTTDLTPVDDVAGERIGPAHQLGGGGQIALAKCLAQSRTRYALALHLDLLHGVHRPSVRG